ncbi:MAG: uracil-xanthine permease family protein [Desulfarculaceae bacterium]|nr:uracil-xanthine permease family protein [Desulfarculaceae bacterium]
MSHFSSPDYKFSAKGAILGAQMLFVAFGALVLVPLLTGLNPNVALFTAGVGTLLFQIITKGKVPVFLASSFAFIAPIIYGTQTWGVPGTMCGLAAAGGLYVIISLVVRVGGVQILQRILPPVVTGPVIMVIGLILAPVAVNMALGKTGDGAKALYPQNLALIISLFSLAVTIGVSLLAKGWLKLVPILIGIGAGYGLSLILGLVNFAGLKAAPWLAVPDFVMPTWNLEAILYIVPIAIAPAIEHFGDILAIGGITGRDYLKEPGIKNTMLGDGLATSLAAFLGGPPNTTYSEVTGAVALTRAFNPAIMTWAAVVAVALAFVGKLGAFLLTIPVPVMGGIMVLLFGAIMVVGINTLVRAGHDLMHPRNLTIVALIVIFGTGGMALPLGSFKLAGIGLAGVLGVVLNLVLPGRKEADAALCDRMAEKQPERVLMD